MANKKHLKTYTVQIGNCSLRLKSSHNSATLEQIIKVVEDRRRCDTASNPHLSMPKIMALSCLNLAEELVCLKQTLLEQTEQLERSTQALYSDLKSSPTGLSI